MKTHPAPGNNNENLTDVEFLANGTVAGDNLSIVDERNSTVLYSILENDGVTLFLDTRRGAKH